ncbi:flagellar M-ring protein FliF [Rhodosalinus halophilus]|uniref:Flagellar M-ring protein n=1 Tax=Rhodosalinus halophilus TaxID=2259333 RepID=A0A365U7V8_9RHOB|nr:flagellar basal-body MS-ring/collar protein FliF [Rhodosalinus halophilus]RBI84639.1 flagellar M-ring protein FliF [Rhodosalinus halophilus]
MQQLLSLWRALSPMRRIVVLGAAAAVFVAVLAMARMAAQPGMALLYAGLDAAAAGEVVSALEARGTTFEVRGDSVFVAAHERDQLRMTLAGEGLPATSAQGYELLDSLSGFGTTSQMFDAAYWRAKEGELARTILSAPDVTAARVHIANAGDRPFRRDLRPTASVSVTMSAGTVGAEQARAIRYLVASAVPGMAPDDVAVIDGQGGLVAAAEEASPHATTGEERAARLRERVLRLVEARVGRGNAVVEVAVETVTEQEMIRERRIDPESRVAISTDTEERSSQSQDTGGDVSVASNLPDGDAASGDRRTSTDTETRERVNFEISETEREVLRTPGAIRRLTVAVLVASAPDGAEPAGATPLPDEELAALRDLVAAAVGFNAERGDEITIRAMPMAALPAAQGTPAQESWFATLNLDAMRLVQLGVLAAVTLVLALFVLRPMLMRPTPGEESTALLAQDPEAGNGPAGPVPAALDGEVEIGPFGGPGLPMAGPDPLAVADDHDGTTETPVERLRSLIEERREETMEILSSWLEDEQERV